MYIEICEWNFITCDFLIFRFIKSAAFEISVSDDVTEEGRYSPRFLDEIADEIDVLEDKKAPLFCT